LTDRGFGFGGCKCGEGLGTPKECPIIDVSRFFGGALILSTGREKERVRKGLRREMKPPMTGRLTSRAGGVNGKEAKEEFQFNTHYSASGKVYGKFKKGATVN